MNWLGDIANLFAVTTGLVAVYGYGAYRLGIYRKRKQVEDYLRQRRDDGRESGKQGAHSLLHLVAKLGMTEAELVQASFQSRHIDRLVRKGAEDNLARDILLVYRD